MELFNILNFVVHAQMHLNRFVLRNVFESARLMFCKFYAEMRFYFVLWRKL